MKIISKTNYLHDQLYVVLSRRISRTNIEILKPDEQFNDSQVDKSSAVYKKNCTIKNAQSIIYSHIYKSIQYANP